MQAKNDRGPPNTENRTAVLTAMIGLVAWGLLVGSSFFPWFRWIVQVQHGFRKESTCIWGPPACAPGLPYISVVRVTSGLPKVNLVVVVDLFYLVLLVLGAKLWSRLVWRSRGRLNRQGLAVVAGAAILAVGVGLITALKLAGQIAQQSAMSVASRPARTVGALLVGVHIEGPLVLVGGIVAAIAAMLVARSGEDDGAICD